MIGTNTVGHRPPHLESAEDTIAGVKAGRFREIGGGKKIFYAEK